MSFRCRAQGTVTAPGSSQASSLFPPQCGQCPVVPIHSTLAEDGRTCTEVFSSHLCSEGCCGSCRTAQSQDGKVVLMYFANASGCNKHDCSTVKCVLVTQYISDKQVIALCAVLGKYCSWKKNILDVPTLCYYISTAEDSIFHVAGEKNQFSSLISLEEYKDW